MPITYPPDIDYDAFTDAPVCDSHARQDRLRARQKIAAQRSADTQDVARNRVARRYCGVREVWLEIGPQRSTSYSPVRAKQHGYYEWDRAHAQLASAAPGRLHFVPGDPSAANLGVGGEVCTIKYVLHKPTRIREATLEVFRIGDPNPLLSVALDYSSANRRLEPRDANGPVRLQNDDLVWDGRLAAVDARVDGQVVDVASSPYKLKLSVKPKRRAWTKLGEAWTYFELLVDSIRLEWGDEAVIPLARNDVDARFQADVRAYEVALLQELKANAVVAGVELDTADHRLTLDSNLFTTNLDGQSGTDLPFRSYKQMWGDGPLIPVQAAITLLRSDGVVTQATAAPWALGAAEFLWDWEDDPANKVTTWAGAAPQRTRDYLTHALDHLVEVEAEAGEAPEGSNNCHRQHGGKRGRGAARVFPTEAAANYTAATAALLPNEPPFEVLDCPARRWAGRSKPRKSGVAAGSTGVMFQPSRIAGDRYRISVYLLTRDFPYDETGPNLRASALPQASSGVFEIWRRVNAWIYRADGTVGNVNTATVEGIFEEARIELEMAPPATVNVGSWEDSFFLGVTDYMTYQNKVWFGTMLGADQAGPDCVQFGDPLNAPAHVSALAATGVWQVQVTGAVNDHSLRPGEPVEHPGTHTRGFVIHREQVGPGYTIYVHHALGQHLAPGPNLTVVRGNIALNVVAVQRMNAPADRQTVEDALNPLCAVGLSQQSYSQVSKGISTRVMREYVAANHAADKGVFFFLFQQMATHAGESRAGGTNSSIATETCAYAYLQDDPALGGGGLKALDLVAAHELGHALFLPHSPHEQGAKPAVHIAVPDNEHDNCIMNYHVSSQHFCGMCMVRLMGWSVHGEAEAANADAELVKMSNVDTGNKREFEMVTLTATLPVTPPRTVRQLNDSTTLNLPTRPTVEGADTTDLTANAPVVLLSATADRRPPLVDAQREGVCGPLRLEATARMPAGSRYVWHIERAPDDHAQVQAASQRPLPTIHESGPNNEFLEVETDATGTFHVKASVDVAGGAAFDDTAEFLCLNLVLLKVERLESKHKFTKHPGGCWLNHGDIVLGSQGGNESAPVRLQTKIRLIGGGVDGRRGLDKVSAGWINNIRSDSTGASYITTDGSGDTWTLRSIPLQRDAGGAAYARLNPQPSDTAPVVDKSAPAGVMTHWTARHGVLTVAQPNAQDALSLHAKTKPIGAHCWIQAEDAPSQGWDIHPPTLGHFDIDRVWLRTKFTAYLCVWTHSAPCLIGVAEELPWELEAEYNVNLAGRRGRAPTKMHVFALAKTKHVTLVSAVETDLEWCPPGSLSCYKPRHMPPDEDPVNGVGFSWNDPTVR
ncbi:hypothetical protein ENSA5_55660 [Enhygromyxa salina]|uniref:Uncharacterized protein n=1 Tax=Enhygromyxa salina TaxID=215803 RepID=A0A2S9XF09_9BACT|nr:hypothetical protein [Enhygromyxa salina]PRP91449.1 hypothetical protein ENSA5_55660 [Enhygromyxa salina]